MPLTIRQIKRAEANGIPKKTLQTRYQDGWDPERMVTEPVRGRFVEWHEHKDLCKQNGIEYSHYYERVKLHDMDPLEAATKPVAHSHADRNRKYPAEYLKLADENGISRTAYYYRIHQGMSYLEAATRPTNRKKVAY